MTIIFDPIVQRFWKRLFRSINWGRGSWLGRASRSPEIVGMRHSLSDHITRAMLCRLLDPLYESFANPLGYQCGGLSVIHSPSGHVAPLSARLEHSGRDVIDYKRLTDNEFRQRFFDEHSVILIPRHVDTSIHVCMRIHYVPWSPLQHTLLV